MQTIGVKTAAMIYYKGPLRLIMKMTSKLSGAGHEGDIDRFIKEGIHAIGFAKRDIDSEDAMEIGRIMAEN